MAIETKCLTPEANFSTYISDRVVSASVHIPFDLGIDSDEAKLLEKLLHNQLELVLRPYFHGLKGLNCVQRNND